MKIEGRKLLTVVRRVSSVSSDFELHVLHVPVTVQVCWQNPYDNTTWLQTHITAHFNYFFSSGNGKFIFNNYTRNCNDLLKYLQREKMCCDCTQTYETIANFSCVSCCPSLKFTLLPWVYKLYSRQFQCKTLSGLEMSSRTVRGFTELFVLGEHETKVRK